MKHLILLAALACPAPALAQSVSAAHPESVSSALQALGFEGQIGTAPNGTPAIVSTLDGARFSIQFYDCDGPLGCQDLQLRAIFATETPVSLDTLNSWNQNAFIGKAFQNEDTVVLEHPIAGADGMSRYAFTRTLARWQLALRQFRQMLAEQE